MIKDTVLSRGVGANSGNYEDLVNMVAASAPEGKLCYAYAERMKNAVRPTKSVGRAIQDKSFGSVYSESNRGAQDKQDGIFRRMPVAKKIRLTGALSALCLKLNRLNANRATRTTSR